jgi:hypothetical protein
MPTTHVTSHPEQLGQPEGYGGDVGDEHEHGEHHDVEWPDRAGDLLDGDFADGAADE